MTYDLIIIGAGPAGLTAAVYAARYKMKVLVIGEQLGGMSSEAHEICNFSTYKKITGEEFTQKMKEQVENLKVKIVHDSVTSLKKIDSIYNLKTNLKEYSSKKIILAMGSEKRKLELENENKFLGKGVSYCATCDAPFFRNKTVGVVGGSNSALTAALLISKFADKIYIIYRQDRFFRAEKMWVEEVENNDKIKIIFNSNVAELKGDNVLEGVKLDNGEELKLDGLFIEIGSIPSVKLAEDLGIELEGNHIKTDKKQKTNVGGIFAAGDITNNPLKQIITACAEGAIAANSVHLELNSEKNS
ncbi:MAG: FAD-dependent oxidoreductase [Candidatus Aenigmarchaeota archaeon]|nr:FAD-dependent oxidoreductase [Candidatus Aenigmarchaeota archaeon]